MRGPIMLLAGVVLITLVILIPVIIARWVFRVNEQINLLTQIRNNLRKLNLKFPEEDENPEPPVELPPAAPPGLLTPRE